MTRAVEAGVVVAALALAATIVIQALPRDATNPSPDAAAAMFRRDPLNVRALRIVALGAAEAGDNRRAAAMLEFVARRTWRDGPTDAWLIRDRLERGDLEGAISSADALLRLAPDGKTRPVLFNLLTAAATFVEARPPLADRLSADPWWRQDFLQYLALHGEPAAATSLFTDLAAGPTPARGVEYAPLIDRLAAAQDYNGALTAWRQIAPRLAGGDAGLRDGDFAGAWDHSPFTWRPADGVGATSEASDEIGGRVKRALRVDYDSFSTPTLPAQLLVLPAGHWRLTWRAQADAQADQRLFWRVRCADSGKMLAGRAGDAAQAPGWSLVTLIFETPASDCRGQWLELAPVPGERRAAVTARYAEFRLEAAP